MTSRPIRCTHRLGLSTLHPVNETEAAQATNHRALIYAHPEIEQKAYLVYYCRRIRLSNHDQPQATPDQSRFVGAINHKSRQTIRTPARPIEIPARPITIQARSKTDFSAQPVSTHVRPNHNSRPTNHRSHPTNHNPHSIFRPHLGVYGVVTADKTPFPADNIKNHVRPITSQATTFYTRGVCGEFVSVRFLVVCFLYKTNPNPRKIICCGKKVGPIATFNLFFLGLGWPWVGEFVGFTIRFTEYEV